ncbi:hypothetical protein SAMN05216464_106118 [Mucilaginibacter pineti]|uniref:Uncharacterized protein n=1 Tax=Mucilaginibacter pineti TaxID=1391627 RepID=A0A1G7CVR4_9SPHI|nr:hypothetical protein [Mucilaginibacter pineti]SDE43333.1 hypothetical protein SAMN05216464_106118 [Mucilaginibacter pineti]
MPNFFKALTTEANPELSDAKNTALEELVSKVYTFDTYQAIFIKPENEYQTGIVEFEGKNSISIKAVFSVYIDNHTVYATLFTLDMKKLIDVPFSSYITALAAYLAGNLPTTADNTDPERRSASL